MKYTEHLVNSFYSTQRTGSIAGADIVNRVVDKETGDAVKLYIIIEDDKIKDAKFQACGSVVLFASMSAILDIAIGNSLQDALAITEKSVIKEIKQVNRCDYSVVSFAVKALNVTINNYLRRLERGTITKSSKPARVKAINPANSITVYKETEVVEFENVYSNMLEETATEKSVEPADEVKIDKFIAEPAEEPATEIVEEELSSDYSAEDIEPTKIEVRVLEQEETASELQEDVDTSEKTSKSDKNSENEEASGEKNEDVIDEIDSITAKLTDAITKLNFKFDVDGE